MEIFSSSSSDSLRAPLLVGGQVYHQPSCEPPASGFPFIASVQSHQYAPGNVYQPDGCLPQSYLQTPTFCNKINDQSGIQSRDNDLQARTVSLSEVNTCQLQKTPANAYKTQPMIKYPQFPLSASDRCWINRTIFGPHVQAENFPTADFTYHTANPGKIFADNWSTLAIKPQQADSVNKPTPVYPGRLLNNTGSKITDVSVNSPSVPTTTCDIQQSSNPQISQWDVNDSKLPKIRQFDTFTMWPQGQCRHAYQKSSSEGARRHASGWAMRNTNNHNSQILKKSCLGVLLCSSKRCVLAMRPAICDKARRRQEGRVCIIPGCTGQIYNKPCRGHGGYPVTHFWREHADTVFFQAKGSHDHPRPDLKPVRETAARRRRQLEGVNHQIDERCKNSQQNKKVKKLSPGIGLSNQMEDSVRVHSARPVKRYRINDQNGGKSQLENYSSLTEMNNGFYGVVSVASANGQTSQNITSFPPGQYCYDGANSYGHSRMPQTPGESNELLLAKPEPVFPRSPMESSSHMDYCYTEVNAANLVDPVGERPNQEHKCWLEDGLSFGNRQPMGNCGPAQTVIKPSVSLAPLTNTYSQTQGFSHLNRDVGVSNQLVTDQSAFSAISSGAACHQDGLQNQVFFPSVSPELEMDQINTCAPVGLTSLPANSKPQPIMPLHPTQTTTNSFLGTGTNSDSTSGGFNASWSTPSPPTGGSSSLFFGGELRTMSSICDDRVSLQNLGVSSFLFDLKEGQISADPQPAVVMTTVSRPHISEAVQSIEQVWSENMFTGPRDRVHETPFDRRMPLHHTSTLTTPTRCSLSGAHSEVISPGTLTPTLMSASTPLSNNSLLSHRIMLGQGVPSYLSSAAGAIPLIPFHFSSSTSPSTRTNNSSSGSYSNSQDATAGNSS